ncbi:MULTISPECIES: HAD family hydrolase [Bacillus]|uniref:HAD family hydrolase n=1 Tax=Bacillus cereus TaxID=1396 RepID=A0A2C1M5Z2_BACCE|nr:MULTISPECIES: HAD family hydrolase [Bacillus]MDH4420054.1 HAD family hydrolase [Bacillus cereus]PER28613.1 HAD family hydrolase [Bacillus cereus]PFA65184.1 HAD family hydrolase [Bacillus sp. AFS015896]PGL87342.1 HAD family hydrolase [Bacillus sp. AFS054943]PGU05465.1 HAD family hydrolase [Bacillus cereus]
MVFFDIDGTLLDYDTAEKNGISHFFQKYKDIFSGNELEAMKLWHELSEEYFNKFLSKELSFQEQQWVRMYHLFKAFGVNLSPWESQHRFKQYIELYKNNWTPFEDVHYTLQTLQQGGHLLGIISNGDYEQQVEKLTALNILQYFKYIFTSSEIGISKPDPVIFQRAVLQSNLAIKDCYYVGDRLETDAISSTTAGMHGIWLNRNNSLQKYDIPTIRSLHEILAII